jgi:hypothetical protein
VQRADRPALGVDRPAAGDPDGVDLRLRDRAATEVENALEDPLRPLVAARRLDRERVDAELVDDAGCQLRAPDVDP